MTKAAAAKPDFFATLFNPPKASAVPARPNAPTQPAAYAGPYQAPYPGSTTVTYVGITTKTAVADLKAQEFVVSGARGGWGAWTLGLVGHGTMPVQRSFGVFGWGASTTTPAYDPEGFSFVQDWRHMCTTKTTAANKNGFCPTGVTAANAGAVKQVLVVSVWANSSAAGTWSTAGTNTASSLKITFNVSAWAQNAAAWAAPTRPGAAAAIKEKAATALAAATAAAAAVAAALY